MAVESWVESANSPGADFPLQNLPYGVFRHNSNTRIGIAIGDQVLDLRACVQQRMLNNLRPDALEACTDGTLNHLMALGADAWSSLRVQLTALLSASADAATQSRLRPFLIPMCDVQMQVPATIGDYTDFYASVHHATRVGKLFRPDNPLLPNYKYVPIGYHGRASSIVVSGTALRRPSGQTKAAYSEGPVFGASQTLD